MKRTFVLLLLFVSFQSYSQSVFGYWYGRANVKTNSSANNYLVEMILQPDNSSHVKGILNYFFKNTYRSFQVKGTYNNATRELTLNNIPVTYYGSTINMEVDCMMNLHGILKVARAGSTLTGKFISLPQFKLMCTDIGFDLTLNANISKKDSVLKAISTYKETYQVWKPSATDTLASINIMQRKVVNYVVENQFRERTNEVSDEIEVNSDSLKVDFYDNGEIDGDSISVFFNNELLAFSQKLSTRPIHFDLVLDDSKDVNVLSMFADNLGSIPPNTALMIVTDGTKRYDIRLTSDLKKNATIKIRRKKN